MARRHAAQWPLLIAGYVAGHPDLGHMYRRCDAAAHPARAYGAHKSPVDDDRVQITLFHATQANRGPFKLGAQPSNWADMNAAQAVPHSLFAEGAEHIVRISRPVEQPPPLDGCSYFDVVLTVSHGSFEDRGKWQTGPHGPEPTTTCAGRHVVSVRKDVSEQLFLWRAPHHYGAPAATNTSSETTERNASKVAADAPVSRSNVTFNVTIACGEDGPFRRAPMLVVAPGAAANGSGDGTTPAVWSGSDGDAALASLEDQFHQDGGFDLLSLLHGWLAVAAFALLFPLSAGCARYAKPPQPARAPAAGDPRFPSVVGWSERWCDRLGGSWLALHRGFALAGAACVPVSLALMEVHKVIGGHGHFHSWHARIGLGAVLLGLLQPLLGIGRPPKPQPGESGLRRRMWRAAHVACAAGLLGAGTFAAVTGVQKAAPHGVVGAGTYEALLYAWLCGCAVMALALEHWRWRRGSRSREGGAASVGRDGSGGVTNSVTIRRAGTGTSSRKDAGWREVTDEVAHGAL